MATQYDSLSDDLQEWIGQQPLFFVATAAPQGRVNVSPKGQDSLRILSPTRLVWLNLTGSGNETAAHIKAANRMTLMWCAFAGPPKILRVYGRAEIVHPRDENWQECAEWLPPQAGARQYYVLEIDLVQTSCGYAVPLMELTAERDVLTRWTEKRGPTGIEAYWRERNQVSIDGFPTDILMSPD